MTDDAELQCSPLKWMYLDMVLPVELLPQALTGCTKYGWTKIDDTNELQCFKESGNSTQQYCLSRTRDARWG